MGKPSTTVPQLGARRRPNATRAIDPSMEQLPSAEASEPWKRWWKFWKILKKMFFHLQVTASRFYQSCFLLLLLLPPPSPPAHPIPGIQTSWVYESLWAKFCTNAYPFSENYGCFWPLHMSGWLVLVIISHLIVVSYPIFLFNSIYIIYIYTPIASPLYPLYQKTCPMITVKND